MFGLSSTATAAFNWKVVGSVAASAVIALVAIYIYKLKADVAHLEGELSSVSAQLEMCSVGNIALQEGVDRQNAAIDVLHARTVALQRGLDVTRVTTQQRTDAAKQRTRQIISESTGTTTDQIFDNVASFYRQELSKW